LVFVSGDLLRFADKFTPFTAQAYLFPQEKTLSFLQKNIGSARYMTTDSRIMAPNFSVIYRLQSVDGYDPLYLKNYAEFIASSEREKPDIHTPFGFNRIITPHNYNSTLMDLLGVKYVLSLEDIHVQKLTKVFQEGQTRVYQNTNVLPRAFFISSLISTKNRQDTIEKLFSIKDYKNTATIEGDFGKESLGRGDVKIYSYQPNNVIIHTENNEDGFLVLSDIFYPTWHATVDGFEVKIFQTDYVFRGIFVPKGSHTIAFFDRLF